MAIFVEKFAPPPQIWLQRMGLRQGDTTTFLALMFDLNLFSFATSKRIQCNWEIGYETDTVSMFLKSVSVKKGCRNFKRGKNSARVPFSILNDHIQLKYKTNGGFLTF